MPLLVQGACSPFPGVSVTFTPPNQSPLSEVIRDHWMSVDRGIADAVQQLMHRRLGPTAVRAEREDLLAAGFICEPAPSVHCAHQSGIRTVPTGPAPATGARARHHIVTVVANAGDPIDSIKVSKKTEQEEKMPTSNLNGDDLFMIADRMDVGSPEAEPPWLTRPRSRPAAAG